MERLNPKPCEVINRGKKVRFWFNGKSYEAYEGDTIASALYSAGKYIFSRSFKYHRARGLLCLSGRCPNCLVEVDGQPNIPACITLVKDGMRIKGQNAWPSLETDFLNIIDKFSKFLPVGFYYKNFINPSIWKLIRPIIRKVAGIGKVNTNFKGGDFEHIYKHKDVVIIGGGPAGLSAALELAKRGINLLLVDEQDELGGNLRYDMDEYNIEGFKGLRGYEIAKKLSSDLKNNPNVEILSNAICFGIYEDNLVGIAQNNRLIKVRAKKIIVATGSFERPMAFKNNDLPGIFFGSAIRKLINLYSVKPGEKILIVTSNDYGYKVAQDVLNSGLKLVAVVDGREDLNNNEYVTNLKYKGIKILNPYTIISALGKKRVKGAIIAKLDKDGKVISGTEESIDCDTISLSIGFETDTNLLAQAGCKLRFSEELNEKITVEYINGVYSAGEVNGYHDLGISILQGRIAGIKAFMELKGIEDPEFKNLIYSLNKLEEEYKKKLNNRFLYSTFDDGKSFTCLCEDITVKDIKLAIEEGFDDLEPLKRYTTFSMGTCQGKMCSTICSSIFADKVGKRFSEVGSTTSRPPYSPIPLGLLAGPPHLPYKLTPLHRRHLEFNPKFIDMGEWKRPYYYTSIEEEYKAIRENVGIIDISTIGKFEIKGKDAAKFLDFVFPNKCSNIKIGKAKYSPLLLDNGVILDESLILRLEEDRFLVTSSSGNAEGFEMWLKWWLSQSDLCVHITNLTSYFASINVAGPKAKDLLSKLVEIDLNSFPDMTFKFTKIDGIECLIFRTGFVGELSWEIYCPSEYGDYLWNKIMEVGKEFNIKPVGVEAMRILSLEMMHFWASLDTDATSTPLETEVASVVKFDKEDFVGKHYLLDLKNKGIRYKLIGFIVPSGEKVETGDLIIKDDIQVGRVTKAAYSYSRKQYIGLAWVPVELASEGKRINIWHDGKVIDAEVTTKAFYGGSK
ncbi:Sarcosine oxidase subunit alpha [archaeon HR06]|nr:Sarcosine oxidase subunit alpha [archaeon HR06]